MLHSKVILHMSTADVFLDCSLSFVLRPSPSQKLSFWMWVTCLAWIIWSNFTSYSNTRIASICCHYCPFKWMLEKKTWVNMLLWLLHNPLAVSLACFLFSHSCLFETCWRLLFYHMKCGLFLNLWYSSLRFFSVKIQAWSNMFSTSWFLYSH